jgi:hypothetical protein
MTHYETTITLLGVVIGILATLIGSVWAARGYVDRLNTTDGRLADAIEELGKTQKQQHADNQRRFAAIERRLANGVPPRDART